VQPTSPAAPWIGGKRNLAARLVEIIEAIPHRCYAEPFVGMGGVFFRRSTRPKAEVINDFNRDVANFFRILQVHFVPFVEMMRYQLTTRAEFERLSQVKPDTLTDLQRAARFLYLQRTGFGGKVHGRVFGTDPGSSSRFDVTKLVPMLEELHGRLAGVVIECLSYGDFIARYDRPETLFYLDPPYWGTEGYYGKELFGRDDFTHLAEQLAGIKGRFVLSINDVPEIRQIFDRFTRRKVRTTYTTRGGHGKPAAELIITGPS
jgi:DNA adenine methylase